MVQGGRPGCIQLERRAVADGLVLTEPGFCVRAVTLVHSSPVLAYAFEPARELNVRRERLQARGLAPGPWLGELKRRVRSGEDTALIVLPDGTSATARDLAEDLIVVSPGKTLVYATDFGDTADNRARLIALARNAHTLFCESTFREAERDLAVRTAHLTTRACAEIAAAAGVARLVPFHFSRRYEHDPAAVYAEIAALCNAVAMPEDLDVDID